MIEIVNNTVNLCSSCQFEYPSCPVEDEIIFGDNTGYDNICCCNCYEPLLERDVERGGYK